MGMMTIYLNRGAVKNDEDLAGGYAQRGSGTPTSHASCTTAAHILSSSATKVQPHLVLLSARPILSVTH